MIARRPAPPRPIHVSIVGRPIAPSCHLSPACLCRPVQATDLMDPTRLVYIHRPAALADSLATIDEIPTLPAIKSSPGVPARESHSIAVVVYHRDASAMCVCGHRLIAASDAELATRYASHLGDMRVRRGLNRRV